MTSLSRAPFTRTSAGFFTKKSLGDTGSIIFLLNASSASNGGLVSASVKPSDSTNLRIASGTKPLFLKAASVGSRGSSQLFIVPLSISGLIFRFETGIPSNSSLENSIRCGFLSFSLSSIAKYSALRSSYSFVLRACVTPSMLSSIGAAKSYVGQTRTLLPSLGCSPSIILNSAGSRIAVFWSAM